MEKASILVVFFFFFLASLGHKENWEVSFSQHSPCWMPLSSSARLSTESVGAGTGDSSSPGHFWGGFL